VLLECLQLNRSLFCKQEDLNDEHVLINATLFDAHVHKKDVDDVAKVRKFMINNGPGSVGV